MGTPAHLPDLPDLPARLRGGSPLYGLWSTLPGVLPVELAARSGADYVVVDLQHGAAAEADLPGMLAAVATAGAIPLVRPRSKAFADIGRVLDLGAHGVVVPNVDSVQDAVAAAAACAYPPRGGRSFGVLRPGPAEAACLVMVESRAALAAVADLARVPGVHGLYVGPYDLGLSLGVPPGDVSGTELSAAVDTVLAAAAGPGLPVGVHAATGAVAARLRERGCRLVTAGSDASALAAALAADLATARGT
jgi:4-hydroxy-2-oxoheptanedioate aldolase